MNEDRRIQAASVGAHLRRLLSDHVAPGVILDVGCAGVDVADELVRLGYTYVGVSDDAAGVAAMRARGLEAHHLDLIRAECNTDQLARIAGDRAVVALVLNGRLEIFEQPSAWLVALRALMDDLACTWLAVVVPNIATVAAAQRLVAGDWDHSPARRGAVTATQLRRVLLAAGFTDGPTCDVTAEASTKGNVATGSTVAPLNRFIRGVRTSADSLGTTQHLVRLFMPNTSTTAANGEDDTSPDPFLSVLVRTRGTRATLSDALTCLAGQTCDDFEVILLIDAIDDSDAADAIAQLDPFDVSFRRHVRVERLRAHNRVVPLNRGIDIARGRYIVILDDDDLVFANWVEDFRDAAADASGSLLRSRAVVQRVVRRSEGVSDVEPVSGFELSYAARFDLIAHLRISQTPPLTMALPRSVFSDLGLRFDPNLPVYEDLDVFLQAAALCGVTDTESITSIYRRWDDSESSVNSIPWTVWEGAKRRLLERLDALPLLLPEGSASRLFELQGELDALREDATAQRRRAEAAEAKVSAFERSRVWRATKPARALLQARPVRGVGRWVMRLVRRARGASNP